METSPKKASSRSLAIIAEVSEALAQVEALKERLATNISLIDAATANLRTTEARLFEIAAYLRNLPKGKGNRRSPLQRPWKVPVGLGDVVSSVQAVPRQGASKRRVESGKRVSRKPSIADNGYTNY